MCGTAGRYEGGISKGYRVTLDCGGTEEVMTTVLMLRSIGYIPAPSIKKKAKRREPETPQRVMVGCLPSPLRILRNENVRNMHALILSNGQMRNKTALPAKINTAL
ncbi:hypothetical protein J3458_000480 [Metarhizium acridum]|uniref:uncharacterized protein n=1 Tax=Metarhizium acridum TaxID=92637 RepID=UPI001C6D1A11|nr:hypothetical protein J3458_000480 [Metarhizium acridum]